MRPQHDCPVAAQHTLTRDDPDRAALETQTLTAHADNLRHRGEVSVRFLFGCCCSGYAMTGVVMATARTVTQGHEEKTGTSVKAHAGGEVIQAHTR